MPFSARRRAVIAPPKPLPMTMTSKGEGMLTLGRFVGSAAHAFLVDANVRGGIVAIVSPAGMMELDDVVGVVRRDGLGEAQFADALHISAVQACHPLAL